MWRGGGPHWPRNWSPSARRGGPGDSGMGLPRRLEGSPSDKVRLEDELSSSIQPLGEAGDSDSGLRSLHEEPPPPIGEPPAPPDENDKRE